VQVVVCAALTALALAGAGLLPAPPVAGQEARPSPLSGAAAIEQLKRDGQYDSLQAAMDQARFSVSHVEETPLGRAAWHAPNRAAGYDAYVTEAGVSIAVNDQTIVGLNLNGVGYGEALQAVAPGEVSADKLTINVTRYGGVREWFVNSSEGLEHGFTLSEPPGGAGARRQGIPLRLTLRVSDGWRAVASDDGQLVTLLNANNQAVEYSKLVARDNLGRNLAARLKVADEQVVIEVEDHDAEYPLTIDPLFTLQERLLATDGAAFEYFGHAVALSGNTALIGAPYDEDSRGSAYVFVRNGATWTEQARLLANDGALQDYFGWSVALKGDTALIGTLYGPGPANADQGAAYVFVRSGAIWTQQQKLTAGDGQAFAQFGAAVALDGDTALVGAHEHRITPSFVATGAAYVFVRNGATWTQQAQLLANDGAGGDQFGAAVALDGDTALVGAPKDDVGANADQGSAYVFTRSGVSWAQQPRLNTTPAPGDHFGAAVALSGDKAMIGAYLYGSDDRGKVFTFRRGATGWKQTDGTEAPNPTAGWRFGVSLALKGDTAVVGASLGLFQPGVDQRSAYVFTVVSDPELVRRLGPELGSANDGFGYAVALDGDTVLVGAYRGDATATDQGAAYAFTLRDSRSVEQQKLIASDGGAQEFFGEAVALSGDTLAVGAHAQKIGANAAQGAVYLFTRQGGVWRFQQKLTANDGAAGAHFGYAVALDGDILAAGAYKDDPGGSVDQGSAYIFRRNGAVWTQQQKITGTGGLPYDLFGSTVALSGQTVAVGAWAKGLGRGAVYVFTFNGAAWAQQQEIGANDSAAGNQFGFAVAVSGDTLAAGAPKARIGLNEGQGAAYVFTRSGATWTQQQKLTASDGARNDEFGGAVALDGDTLAVGAMWDDIGSNADQGSAYVFTRSGGAWAQRQKLVAGDGAREDFFGASVALSGSLLVVGARGDDIGASVNQGSAYVFTHIGGWYPQQKLIASDGAAVDEFGAAVALSGDTVAAGARYDHINPNFSQGSAYVFVSPPCPAVSIAPESLPNGRLNTSYNQQLTAGGSGVGDYFFAVSRGALPPGLTLDPPGLLHGAPTTAGIYRFTITTTFFLSGCNGSREYTLTITPPCPPLTVLPETLPNGTTGAAYSQGFTATGGAPPYSFTVAAGALPPGLSLSAGGVLGGAPTEAGDFNFTLRVSDANGCAETRALRLMIKAAALAVVSAASYKPGAAPESIVAAFGAQMATRTQAASGLPLPTELAGVSVRVRDSQGVERLAPLFFVSPGQINLQIPAGAAPGPATINLNNGATGQFEITRTAPSLFAANANGQGVPAAVFLRVRSDGSQSYEPVARLEGGRFVPAPVDLGPAGDQVFLVLFGTGIRFGQTVTASAGGVSANVLFAGGAAGFAGLDQINLSLPRALAGRGEVDVLLRVDGVAANPARVSVR
jgi:uncharacterized protein (TIGR03437 family)